MKQSRRVATTLRTASFGVGLGVLALAGCSGAPQSDEALGESTDAVITADLTAYETSGLVTVNYTNMEGAASDWIGIALVGSPATSYVAWKYTGGGTSGSVAFTKMPAGTYVARAFYNWIGTRSYTIQQTSAAFSVSAGVGTLAANAASYAPGAPITVSYTGLPAEPKTWIALAVDGSQNGSYLSYQFTGGLAAGSVQFTAPAAGTYIARAFRSGSFTPLNQSAPFSVTRVGGLTGSYYDDMDFTGALITRVDSTVDFDWGGGSQAPAMDADSFSVRWTGSVVPRYSQLYTFYTVSDDGIRLWINGQQIIDNWTDHGPTEDSGTITLVAGQAYPVTLEFYENGGGAVAQFFWSSPSQPHEAVPSSQLNP